MANRCTSVAKLVSEQCPRGSNGLECSGKGVRRCINNFCNIFVIFKCANQLGCVDTLLLILTVTVSALTETLKPHPHRILKIQLSFYS